MTRHLISLFVIFISFAAIGQTIDVQHYRFELELSDNSDAITGKAFITTKFLTDASSVSFDLASITGDKGFYAFQVKEGAQLLPASHQHDKVLITLQKAAHKGEIHTYEINYMGTPKDGLIISKNKYGDRTFFADNWPNRAHQWIPCNDRPDDKASFEFIVKAAAHYKVVSNGVLVEEKKEGANTRTHWKEDIPLSTKIMVIGVAKFAVKKFADSPKGVPVSAWVYPQDSSKGFYDYGVAPEILKFFSNYIAPFPYRKLANVQSKTIFGGMENASAIFYAEESVTGNRKWEDVIAHEIVHQWFGDAASEKNFAHLWLSEGFATYLTDLYIETKFGRDSAVKRLQLEREKVVRFIKKNNHPVVDTTEDLMSLLNANSYQKGAWVLHMIRSEVGDSLFQKVVQKYYQQYKGSNADTRDFESVVENVTGKNWKLFFDQWLYQPGIPKLEVQWKADDKEIKIEIKQSTSFVYRLPVNIFIRFKNGGTLSQHLFLSQKEIKIKMDVDSKATSVMIDPNHLLLHEALIHQN